MKLAEKLKKQSTGIKACVLIIICLIFIKAELQAQYIIEGFVSDTSGQTVPFAQIALKTTAENKVVNYTQADVNGIFSMQTDKAGDYYVGVYALSFSPGIYPLIVKEESPLRYFRIDAVLTPVSMEINEVVIITDIPIKEKRDTIVFNAASFLKGNEEVAEDLLKNLPGVDVDPGGTIRIRGKEIEKIMIEGDDLFEKGYRLISKNLHVDVINKVEVLLNYSDQPLLKDFENKEKVAINLTLKEDAKMRIFGDITAGLNTEGKHEARQNLMSFRKKLKLYAFGNSNSLGYDLLGDAENFINPVLAGNDYIPVGLTTPSYLISLKGSRPDIGTNRTLFNNDGMLSFNSIYSPTDHLKIKAVSLLTTEKEDYFRNSTHTYIAGDMHFSNTENYRLNDHVKNALLKLEGNWSKKSDSKIDYKANYNFENRNAASSLLFNQDVRSEGVDNQLASTDQIIAYIKKQDQGKAYIITGRIFTDNRSEAFHIKGHSYPENLFKAGGASEGFQEIKSSFLFSGTEGTWLFSNTENRVVRLRAGYKYTRNIMESKLSIRDSLSHKLSPADNFTNHNDFNSTGIYTGISGDKLLRKVLLSASLNIHGLNYKLANIIDNHSSYEGRHIYANPKLSVKWNINQKQSLTGTYLYNTHANDLHHLLQQEVMISYNTLTRGTGSFELLKGHVGLLVYNHGTWLSRKHFHTTILYVKDEKYIMPVNLISPFLIRSSGAIDKGRESLIVSSVADVYIRSLRNNLKISLNFSNTRSRNIINELTYPVNWTMAGIGPQFKSVFHSFFNYHAGSRISINYMESGSKNYSIDQFHFIDLHFKVNDNIYMVANYERYQFGSFESGKKAWNFLDASLNWNIKPNKWRLGLNANNILNMKEYGTYGLTELGMSSVTYRLLPGYILLKAGYRL